MQLFGLLDVVLVKSSGDFTEHTGGRKVVHETDRAQDGVGDTNLANVFFDEPLCFKVRHARFALCTFHGRVNIVFDARFERLIGDQDTLLGLIPRT